jgi:hypothetical protein
MSGIDQRIPGTGTTGSTIYVNNAYRMGSTVSYAEGRAFGGNLWAYWTTDVTSAVYSTGYFSDAGQLGMRPGDVVMIVGGGSTVPSSLMLRFCTVGTISTGGAASLSTAAASLVQGTS